MSPFKQTKTGNPFIWVTLGPAKIRIRAGLGSSSCDSPGSSARFGLRMGKGGGSLGSNHSVVCACFASCVDVFCCFSGWGGGHLMSWMLKQLGAGHHGQGANPSCPTKICSLQSWLNNSDPGSEMIRAGANIGKSREHLGLRRCHDVWQVPLQHWISMTYSLQCFSDLTLGKQT